MEQPTSRQTDLLKIVIEDYINSAKPVGSVEMVKKHGLKVSAATVRNEMVKLIEKGLVAKTHSSSGRVPTPLGLRLYLDSLMEEEVMPVLTEVAVKQRLWADRFETEKLLGKLALTLSENTGYLSFVSTGDEYVLHSGAVNVLNHPEFFDIEVTRAVLNLLDHEDILGGILNKATADREIHILMGEELGNPNLLPVCLVFTEVADSKKPLRFGVIGPRRMVYKKVLPLFKFLRSLIVEIGKSSK
ncbi:MAG: hypothetical protein M1352_01040 [Patescibacteria group bacterium]|nr:hypothetical protein [Patescibacteria group bacterium]